MKMDFSVIGKASDGRVEGIATISGGVYDNLKIDGVCTAKGDIEAKRLSIDGTTTCEGAIICDELNCNGIITIRGNVKAGKIDIDGVATIGGEKVEADKINCDGVITMEGEISADEIFADGFINAREIVGDSITINSKYKSILFKIFASKRIKKSRIQLIEATTIMLRYTTAKTVSGKDISIGPGCDIEHVDCSGTLKLDPTANVGELIGDYTKQD